MKTAPRKIERRLEKAYNPGGRELAEFYELQIGNGDIKNGDTY